MTGKCAERTKHKLWTTQPRILMIPSNQLTQCNSQPSLLDTTMTLCVNIYFSFVVFSSFQSWNHDTPNQKHVRAPSTWFTPSEITCIIISNVQRYIIFLSISFFQFKFVILSTSKSVQISCRLVQLMQKPIYLCMYLSGILFAQGPVSRNSQ